MKKTFLIDCDKFRERMEQEVHGIKHRKIEEILQQHTNNLAPKHDFAQLEDFDTYIDREDIDKFKMPEKTLGFELIN